MSSTLSLKQLINELEILESDAAKEISAAENSEVIEKLRLGFLGKKGKLSLLLGEMKNLSNEERPLIGQRANVLKTQLQELIKDKLEFLKTQALNQTLIKNSTNGVLPVPPKLRLPTPIIVESKQLDFKKFTSYKKFLKVVIIK